MESLKEKKARMAEEKLAAQLGITPEELADRNVPDLGFDENGERYFDYGGSRGFIVTITPAMEFAVFETASGQADRTRGKKTKSLPKPGKKDDAEKAAAALEEFKQLKKELRAVVKKQKYRMGLALMTGRCWSVNAWKRLFGENPVMRPLSVGLVWGIYGGEGLVQGFRRREDGLFYREDGEEFELPEKGNIRLVHPIELTKEERRAWEDQLEEDELEQPIDQLDRKVYVIHKTEAAKKELVRLKGKLLLDHIFGDELEKFGWHCAPQDDGYYEIYYREDPDAGLCVELHTSGNTIWEEIEVTLHGARFYKSGTFDWENHVYHEEDKEKAYALRDIPARYFSEVVWQIMAAAVVAYLGD